MYKCVFCRQEFRHENMVQRVGSIGATLPCCFECLKSKMKQQEEQYNQTYSWWYRIQQAISTEKHRRDYVKRIVEVGDFAI